MVNQETENPPKTPRIWKIAPGEDAAWWKECEEGNCILFGWDRKKDLSHITEGQVKRKSARRLSYVFAKEVQIDDIVVANKGARTVRAIGIIKSSYLPPTAPMNPTRTLDTDHRRHARLVDWVVKKEAATFRKNFFAQQTVTSFEGKWPELRSAYANLAKNDKELEAQLKRLDEHLRTSGSEQPPVRGDDRKDSEMIKKLTRLFTEHTRNIILYGPPGTGKTLSVSEFAEKFTSKDKVEFVTFHQSFAYEEFVEGLKPQIDAGQVVYKVMPGVFKRICESAKKDPDNKYLLIIDEINRANIAKVFGELITLIEDDKRLGAEHPLTAKLPYSGVLSDRPEDRFGVPKNVYLLGTMNTADKSIALVDLALRRRFAFVELMPKPSLLRENAVDDVDLEALLTRLNERITALRDRDHQIGHSYFMGIKNTGDLRFAWYDRVVPLLQEYFYNNREQLKALLGSHFVYEIKTSSEVFDSDSMPDNFDPARLQFEIKKFEDDDPNFLAALRNLATGKKDDGIKETA